MLKSLFLAACVAALATTPAVAEVAKPARAATTNVAPAARAPLKLAKKQSLPLITFVPPVIDVKLIPLASMDGWTPVTNTATIGGASLYERKGRFEIAVTGSDKTLYIAPFNPVSPGLIASVAWQNIAYVSLTSQPNCTPGNEGGNSRTDYYIICAGLGETGNAVVNLLQHSSSSEYYYLTMENQDLGGRDAGSAPVFAGGVSKALEGNSADTKTPMLHNFTLPLFVWGGANGKLFSGSFRLTAQASMMTGVTEAGWFLSETTRPWAALSQSYKAVPGCSASVHPMMCTTVTDDGRIRVLQSVNDASPYSFLPEISAPAPVGLSGETAIAKTTTGKHIVLARGKDGKLYRTVYNGKAWSNWTAEGGYMMAHTVPSCVTVNEAAICAVQGLDGRIYARQISSAGAL